jgi:hypothetical protein
VVLDAFSRRVVAWPIADHIRSELIVDPLQMTCDGGDLPPARRWPASDHGSPGTPQGGEIGDEPCPAQRSTDHPTIVANTGHVFTSNLIGQSEVVDQLLQRLDQRRLRPAVDRDSAVPADADLDAIVLDIKPKVSIPTG